MLFVLLISLVGLFAGGGTQVEGAATFCNVFGGSPVGVGSTFRHPANKCYICLCCKNGRYTCAPRECPALSCGINKQTSWSADGCCKECCEECQNETCTDPQCGPGQAVVYEHDACCPSCGCVVDLGQGPVTVPQGPFGHTCENCVCHADGTHTCNRPACPSELLECVNPSFDNQCNYACPDGFKTCRRGDHIIPGDKFIRKKDKICTCASEHFYTRGFCFNVEGKLGQRFQELKDNMCVADPTMPDILPDPTLVFQGP